MKRFLKGISILKTSASLMFTAAVVIYLTVSLFFGARETSNRLLWSLLGACVAGALVQGLCFSDWVFRRLRYTWRSLLFCGLYLPALAAMAWAGRWFPMELRAWALFLGFFLAIFAVMAVGFELYFRAVGRRYDGFLGQYRRQREEQEAKERENR